MLSVTRRYHFEAAHFLPHVPDGHKCKRMHGHNYEVEVTIGGPVIKPEGWIMDFFDMDALVAPILKRLDHYTLNDIEGLKNPTVEHIAPWFMSRVQSQIAASNKRGSVALICERVRVYETKDCWADATDDAI